MVVSNRGPSFPSGSSSGNVPDRNGVLLSDIFPDCDVRMGYSPSYGRMTIEELLRPTILKVSDIHLGLSNAYIAQLYEMRECVVPEFVVKNGDNRDLQALERSDVFLTIMDLCLLDQANWLQSIHNIYELDTEGNHDQKLILAVEEARRVCLNIFPGIRIKHPAQRDVVVIHGHHFDSPDMIILPMRIAAGIYDDMVSTGADGAATAKIITKLILDGLGYEEAYKYVSHIYDANLEIGHLHLVKLLNLPYKEKRSPETLKKDLNNFGKNALISSVLFLHRTGALEALLKRAVIPAFRKAAAFDVNIRDGPSKKIDLRSSFARVARQMLPVLEKDPGISLLEGLSLEKLRPLYRNKTPAQTASGATVAGVNVYGCWIDKRATFGATYKDGVTHAIDWMKMREKVKDHLGLPDQIPDGNDLVLKHFQTYPGFHPRTLEQMKFFYEQRGVLSDEKTRELSALPALKAMPTLTVSEKGKMKVVTPDKRPLVRAEMPEGHEVIHPRHILNALETLDLRTANDLRARIESSSALKKLLDPEDDHVLSYRMPIDPKPRHTLIPCG
jgi:hypothetical protein